MSTNDKRFHINIQIRASERRRLEQLQEDLLRDHGPMPFSAIVRLALSQFAASRGVNVG
jgi:hypothetical protein